MIRCVHDGLRHTDGCFDRTHWHAVPWSQVYREGDVLRCRGCGWVDTNEVLIWRFQDKLARMQEAPLWRARDTAYG